MNTARTPAFYIANLGSEVARLNSALEKGDSELAAGAQRRAREIFAKLAEMPMRKSAKAEMRILQEVVEDVPKLEHRFEVSKQSLESYFLPFARKVLGV